MLRLADDDIDDDDTADDDTADSEVICFGAEIDTIFRLYKFYNRNPIISTFLFTLLRCTGVLILPMRNGETGKTGVGLVPAPVLFRFMSCI